MVAKRPLGNKRTATLEGNPAADSLQISAISAKENGFDTLFGCNSLEQSGGEAAGIKSAMVAVHGPAPLAGSNGTRRERAAVLLVDVAGRDRSKAPAATLMLNRN